MSGSFVTPRVCDSDRGLEMVRGCARWLVVCLFVLLSITSAHAMPASSETGAVRLPGHVLPALAKATLVPSKPESDALPITLTIVLKRDDQTGFDRYLHEIYDPHSKYFHHYLSQDQIADRFGPSQQDYFSVLDYMRANRFELVQRIDQSADAHGPRKTHRCRTRLRDPNCRLPDRQRCILCKSGGAEVTRRIGCPRPDDHGSHQPRPTPSRGKGDCAMPSARSSEASALLQVG